MSDRQLSTPSDPTPQPDPLRRAQSLRAANKRRGRWSFLWDWGATVLVAIVVVIIIHTFIVQPYTIPSGSMEHTLLVGDFLLVNKAVYGAEIPFLHKRLPAFEKPKRGDVIVFDFPRGPSKVFVKRLIGLPGDTVAMRDGVLLVNGVRVDEPYVIHEGPRDRASEEFLWQRPYLVKNAEASIGLHPSGNNWGPLVVPDRNYFTLGDNRDDSWDSRYWGFVPDSLLRGRPMIVYYSCDHSGHDRHPCLTNVRWSRIGTRIH
ncbi:MAG TPA: signal peptidase I [Gemmatimonadaceae bacterium]|nr:signal peptidase I [Gemmatimonadaceae bacterium]